MCFFDGGGGDNGASQREAERQKKTESALNALNLQFGINGYTAPNREDFRVENQGSGPHGTSLYSYDDAAYQAALDQYIQAGTTAQQNQAARQAMYDETRTNVRDYYLNDLTDQQTVADREARFNLARRGVRGGSSDIDTQSDIKRANDKAVLDIGNRADAAGSQLKTADEQTRIGLIDRVNAGMSGDSAIQSALQQLSNNLDSVRSNAQTGGLGQIFADYGAQVNTNNQQAGVNRAMRDYYGTYNPNLSSYRGRNY